MTESLNVDTSRLKGVGDRLRSLVFPQSPSVVSVSGTDAVSAAINETMPVIELPVIDGLPAARAALTMTGSKIATAAATYAEADDTLGSALNRHHFDAASAPSAADGTKLSSVDEELSAQSTADETEEPPLADEPGDQPDEDARAPRSGLEMATQLGQFAATAETVGTSAQTVMQTIQGATQSEMSSGQPPAPTDDPEAAEETEETEEPAEDATDEPGSGVDGAAGGDQPLEAIPLESVDDSMPEQRLSPAQPSPVPSARDL